MEALNIAKELLGADYIIQDYVEEYDDFFWFYYGQNNSAAYHPGLPVFSGWDGDRLAFFVSRHTGQIKPQWFGSTQKVPLLKMNT